MKIISMKCPQCAGALEIPENEKQINCPFCGTPVFLDDEVQHVQFDNSERAGYDFEKGRIKAQQDYAAQRTTEQQAAIRAQQEAERKKKKRKSRLILIIVAAFIFLSIIGMIGSKKDDNNGSGEKSVWATEIEPLDSFDYYVDGESIVLKEYKGHDKTVRIAPTYEVNGVSYGVKSLESAFTLKNVSSVIIPEGVTSIEHNAFNSCGVKYLYIPLTLTDFDGWGYFHDGEILYFGGTEEQWNTLFTGERKDIDFKQIIYDAKIDDLIKPEETTSETNPEG